MRHDTARAHPSSTFPLSPRSRRARDSVEWLAGDGDAVRGDGSPVALVHGAARSVLLGERTALNLLARASGIATRYVALVLPVCSNGRSYNGGGSGGSSSEPLAPSVPSTTSVPSLCHAAVLH